MTNSLYYPNIEPPLGWLKTYLLFHNQIARIVPPNIGDLEGEDFKRFRDAFPDAICDIHSNEDIIDLDDIALHRLDRAFKKIAEGMKDFPPPHIYFDKKRKGYFALIPGFSSLHRSKVSNKVNEMFNVYNLAPKPYQQLIPEHLRSEFIWVKDEAASLLLALLADRVARDEAFDTVTDNPLNFSMLALNGMGAKRFSGTIPGGHVDKLIAQAVITIHVPKAIDTISLKDYEEIRKQFSSVREPFDNLIKEQLSSKRLNEITDATTLERYIKEEVTFFSERLDKVGRRENKRFLKYWTPFTVISLLGIAAAFPVSTPITVGLAAVSATIGIVDKIVSPPSPTDKQARIVQRKLAQLEAQLASEEVSKLASELL